jgi:hypothetical protein
VAAAVIPVDVSALCSDDSKKKIDARPKQKRCDNFIGIVIINKRKIRKLIKDRRQQDRKHEYIVTGLEWNRKKTRKLTKLEIPTAGRFSDLSQSKLNCHGQCRGGPLFF